MQQFRVIICLLLVLCVAEPLNRLPGNRSYNAIPEEDIKFYLYTRDNPVKSITITTKSLGATNMNRNSVCKVIAHSAWIYNPYLSIKDGYLKKENYHVILVDWKIYANKLELTGQVGQIVAKLLIALNDKYSIPFEHFHLIGHGFGAHMMGNAGKYLLGKKFEKVGRITGLDPTGLSGNDIVGHKNLRLNNNDAILVDVIHTNAGIYGTKNALGHLDFYPNGGEHQPGCKDAHCSFERVLYYFHESIYSTEFKAKRCRSYKAYKDGQCVNKTISLMGENIVYSNNIVHGKYYLETNSKSPFAKHTTFKR